MDELLLHFFNRQLANPLLDAAMLAFTFGAYLLIPGAGILPYWKAQRRTAYAQWGAAIVALLVALLFQELAMRPRPVDVRLIWPQPQAYSFPSGHAAIAFAFAAAYAANRQTALPRKIIAWIAASLIALSRVYLGFHFPSDILAGAMLGGAIGVAAQGMSRAGNSPQQVIRWMVWPQIALVLLISWMAYLNFMPFHLLQWPGADKVMHFLLFGGVVFWLNIWLDDHRLRFQGTNLPTAFIIPFAFTALEEGLQAFSPHRSMDAGDLLSDLAGMLFFLWLSRWVLKTRLFRDEGLRTKD